MNKLPLLQLDDIRKTYNGQTFALDGISLSVDAGEIVCLLGPSGCGKTTLLRIIAGLEKKDRGRILFKGRNLDDTPVHERNFGLMFQDFALFPHKSVAENVAFGLRMARWPAARAATRVNEMLALVDLPGHTQRSIFELSGGERQRVALARSLAPSPELLMLDEPLGSLDRKLREELMAELRKILKTVGQTAVYVTHDQEEAFEVADRIVILDRGSVQQIDPPQTIYKSPANPFVARFLGFSNLLSAQIEPGVPPYANTSIGKLPLPRVTPAVPSGNGTVVIRPDAAVLAQEPDACDAETAGILEDGRIVILNAVLETVSFRGSQWRIEVSVPDTQGSRQLSFFLPTYRVMPDGTGLTVTVLPAPGTKIRLHLLADLIAVLPATSDARG